MTQNPLLTAGGHVCTLTRRLELRAIERAEYPFDGMSSAVP